MITTEHPIRQLLWCALNALKTAQEDHNIVSETGLRRYLLERLSGANRHPKLRSLPGEIMALKTLTEKDHSIPIIGTLNTLFLSSATVGEYSLFRSRAVLGELQKTGRCTYVCPRPERIFNESIERTYSGKRHLLQLSRAEECFLPAGDMGTPVMLQLITPLHHKTMQLLETAKLIFSSEGFQVVRGYEHQSGIERRGILFHALFIGLPNLPEDVWGATQEQTTITLHWGCAIPGIPHFQSSQSVPPFLPLPTFFLSLLTCATFPQAAPIDMTVRVFLFTLRGN